jgi:hypothetical protein
MPDKQVFEYAVIRVVPRVERGEFLNVGVIILVKATGFLGIRYRLDHALLQALFPQLDLEDLACHLQSFQKICSGQISGGPIAALDAPSRFRWLTAKRSTIIQCSEVHPGLTTDGRLTLDKLFEEMADR